MSESEKVQQGGLEHVEQISPGSKQDESSEEHISPWGAAKENPRVILCCIIMSLSPLVTGFDSIIIALVTAMPAFQMVYGDTSDVIPAEWLSLWTSMVAVGVITGAMLSGPIADRWGCRIPISIGGVIGVTGSIICAFSDEIDVLQHRRILFLFAKIIVGLGLGFMLPASQTYISEVAPVELKGPLLSAYTLSMVCGQVIAVAGVNSRIGILSRMAYRLLLAIEAVPTGFAALAPWFVPESPSYFVKHGKLPKAIAAYSRLFPKEQAEPAIQRFARAVEHERIAMIQNSTYFFELGGMSAQNALNVTTASLALMILALCLSWYLMGHVGYRKILLYAISVITVLWLVIGIAGCFGSTTAFWFVGCAMVVTNFVYGLGVGSTYPVISGETSTLRLRAKTQALGFAVQFLVSWVFQFVVPYMYSTSEGDLGVVFFEIPEMKGLRLEELDTRFEQRVATRAFQRAENRQLGE
ncbi:hypothetical protein N7540_003239 [Penicillium herquei]|nr:hypothetical protein N7540_003239 [Penicillium herquei]